MQCNLTLDFSAGRVLTLKEAKRKVEITDGVDVHENTVQRNLRQMGVRAYVKPTKPKLTSNHVTERLRFAKEHANWTVDQWKQVMFSDETTFSRVGSFGRQFHNSDQKHRLHLPHQIKESVQAGGRKIFFWGAITYFGVSWSCRVDGGTMYSQLYIDVLNDYVLKTRDHYHMDPDTFIFQQDNASAHTAQIVTEWFETQGITKMRWPPNSPDLNPIEHVWAYMKWRLSQYPTSPTSITELWERVQDIWEDLPKELLPTLYRSMPRRIDAVLKQKGGPTDY